MMESIDSCYDCFFVTKLSQLANKIHNCRLILYDQFQASVWAALVALPSM